MQRRFALVTAPVAVIALAAIVFASAQHKVAARLADQQTAPPVVTNRQPNAPFVKLRVNQTQSWVFGSATPGTTVTLTLMRAGTAVETQSRDANNVFFVGFNGPSALRSGDVIKMMSSVGISATIDVIPMTSHVHVITNTLAGHVNAAACPAGLTAEVWAPGGPTITATTDTGCNYSVAFGGYQIRMGDTVALWYMQPDGNEVGIVRSALRTEVDVDDDTVMGATAPGASVEMTVASSALKAAASTVADANGQYMFNLYGPGISHGDTVTVTNGLYQVVVHVPLTLTAHLDPVADTISGYAPPNATLQGNLWDSPVGNFNVTADGAGFYSFNTNQPPYNFDLQATNWGQMALQDANGEAVNVHFGAVDLNLNKNAYNGGQATPGGRFVYELNYGSPRAPAQDVVITDTLPDGVSYVSNSANYPATVNGNTLVISAGLAHAYQNNQLLLTVEFSPGLHVGDAINNTATVGAAQVEMNPGNNTASHSMNLAGNNTNLYVKKFARTGDPVPGEQMIYEINYGNQGSTGSGPVRITDTLPANVTFVRWWSDEPGWSVVMTGTQVVWQRDAVGGNQGSQLYAVVQLDAGLGQNQQLHNTVQIGTPNETDYGNNTNSNDAYTGSPRHNLTVKKSLSGGVTVAGNQLNYFLSYDNNGNTTAHSVLLTDTLPAGTSFVDAGYGTPNGFVTVPYSYHVGNMYVWDLGTLIPGAFGRFDIRVRSDASTPAGTMLTNVARISGHETDTWPFDDVASVSARIYPSGPNLHIYKEWQWNGNHSLRYTLFVANRGDAMVSGFQVTDTYPLSTTLNGWFPQGVPGGVQVNADTSNPSRAVFTVNQLNAGETLMINLELNLASILVDQPGLLFTNTLTATLPPGDTDPVDNAATAVAFSGPDLYAIQHVADTVASPGKVITYQLEYGNHSDMWDAQGNTTWLVESLPAGMTLVSANPAPDMILGNYLVWLNGRLGRSWRNVIEMTVQLTTTVKGGDSFISVLSIHDSNSASVEPYYDNNTDVAVVAAPYHCYVPVLMR
jgi:uncharacterized repeat protein (TIGR01451 family)